MHLCAGSTAPMIVCLTCLASSALSQTDKAQSNDAPVSQEEDFVFEIGGEAGSANWLTENLRLGVDLVSRYETTRERSADGVLFAVGLDIHKVISTDNGDIGTLLLQPYVVWRDELPFPPHVDSDDQWVLEAHDFYFNLTRFGKGRSNIKVGHFDLPYGLEPQIDTHFTLHRFAPMQNLGAKKDWGVSLNGVFPKFDYELSLTRGSGMELIGRDDNLIVAGRIGTPGDQDLVFGISGMYAEIIDPMHVMRYRMGLPMAERMMFSPSGDIVRRHRVGLDVTSIQGPFTLRGEISGGRDFDQDVFLALADTEWSSPEGKLKAWVQGLYWGQDGTTGWDADLTVRTGLAWHVSEAWELSAQLAHDLQTYQSREDDTSLTVQLRWSF